MSPEEGVMALVVLGGGFWVLAPIARAVAKRIAGEVPAPQVAGADAAVLSELQQLRRDLDDLAERVDFTERILAKQKDANRLGSPGGS